MMVCERAFPLERRCLAPGAFALQTRRVSLKSRIFLGLVVIAQVKHPVPSRTRKLSTVAPMVLHLKVWESRAPPNLEKSSKNDNK